MLFLDMIKKWIIASLIVEHFFKIMKIVVCQKVSDTFTLDLTHI